MQAGRLAPGTAVADEPVADQMRVDLFDACDMRGRAIAGELIAIASRGGDGLDRVALFITQIDDLAGDQRRQQRRRRRRRYHHVRARPAAATQIPVSSRKHYTTPDARDTTRMRARGATE